VLTGDQHPHFTVINEFRLLHMDSFVDLFVQVFKLCGKAGLLDLEHVSLDGSKVNANASKHKAMSYGRMQRKREGFGVFLCAASGRSLRSGHWFASVETC
jgi:transposase